jgi:hypothetical protein
MALRMCTVHCEHTASDQEARVLLRCGACVGMWTGAEQYVVVIIMTLLFDYTSASVFRSGATDPLGPTCQWAWKVRYHHMYVHLGLDGRDILLRSKLVNHA